MMLRQYCTNCGEKWLPRSKFCANCGSAFSDPSDSEKMYFERWMQALQHRIRVVHNTDNIDAYLRVFYETGFHKTFFSAISTWEADLAAQANGSRTIEHRTEDLLDFFIVHHCPELHQWVLKESLLKYQKISSESVPWLEMILAYLDFDTEPISYYIDFLKTPLHALKNASAHFLTPPKNEKIWLIADLSAVDSFKEGFALTEKGIYWKVPLQKAKVVAYTDLGVLRLQKDWLLINGHFFNATPSINLKLLYLLLKLKRVFAR